MTEVLLLTQETCGACTTQREKNEGFEAAYPDVEFREVDVRNDVETAEKYSSERRPRHSCTQTGSGLTSSSESSTETN